MRNCNLMTSVMDWADMWLCGPRPGYLSGLGWRTLATKARNNLQRQDQTERESWVIFLLSPRTSPCCSCFLCFLYPIPFYFQNILKLIQEIIISCSIYKKTLDERSKQNIYNRKEIGKSLQLTNTTSQIK